MQPKGHGLRHNPDADDPYIVVNCFSGDRHVSLYFSAWVDTGSGDVTYLDGGSEQSGGLGNRMSERVFL